MYVHVSLVMMVFALSHVLKHYITRQIPAHVHKINTSMVTRNVVLMIVLITNLFSDNCRL